MASTFAVSGIFLDYRLVGEPQQCSRQSEELRQIRAELAMLNQEMSKPGNDFYQVWLPFGLGAGMALGVFILVSLMRH